MGKSLFLFFFFLINFSGKGDDEDACAWERLAKHNIVPFSSSAQFNFALPKKINLFFRW